MLAAGKVHCCLSDINPVVSSFHFKKKKGKGRIQQNLIEKDREKKSQKSQVLNKVKMGGFKLFFNFKSPLKPNVCS